MFGTSSDLLVDVARAADPQREAAARRRLDSLAPSSRFGSLLVAPASQQPRIHKAVGETPRLNKDALPAKTAHGHKRDGDAYGALGALLLQKAFESIIPASSSTGASKSASAVWKSMLARQLADVASSSVFPARAASRETGAERISS